MNTYRPRILFRIKVRWFDKGLEDRFTKELEKMGSYLVKPGVTTSLEDTE